MTKKKFNPNKKRATNKASKKPDYKHQALQQPTEQNEAIRLNKYIANAGVCSRREADKLIEKGEVTVDGEVIKELGYKVQPGQVVVHEKSVLKPENKVYILLNKPKGFLSTTSDPDGRKTVMDLVSKACPEKIFPVGRLDRSTTGLLLFTNDGQLSKKLTQPKHQIKKIYQVSLNKPITKNDFDEILSGITLDDEKVFVDDLAVVDGDNSSLGIEIHLGKNRIVKRIFEHFGYTVTKLDRVVYGSLTKKDLPRGKWRFLTEKEVLWLK